MKIDVAIPFDATSTPEQARRAEEFGYDALWSAETAHDPFFPLVLAASATSRVQLGTSIAVAFARNPMTVATQANDLQLYSEGRFILGLGSQIKPHIERRFSMPWSHPAARMREFVLALRAIWHSWSTETPLEFRGEFYTHTLMTPMFDPGVNPHGPPKVFVAAVGDQMTRVAAEVADGMLVHGFTTAQYLRQHTLPTLEKTFAESGRSRAAFELFLPALVVTGADDEQMERAADLVRRQISFYGSTPAYRPVLEEHGWGALSEDLHVLSKRGAWQEMATLIDDDVLDAFAVVAAPDKVAEGLHQKWGGLVDRLSLYMPYEAPEEDVLAVIGSLRARAELR